MNCLDCIQTNCQNCPNNNHNTAAAAPRSTSKNTTNQPNKEILAPQKQPQNNQQNQEQEPCTTCKKQKNTTKFCNLIAKFKGCQTRHPYCLQNCITQKLHIIRCRGCKKLTEEITK